MQISKQYFMTAMLVAGFGLSFAPPAQAQAAPTQQQLDSTISTFNSLLPEQRQQMLNSAMDAFKNMPEDQKQALINQAKARAQGLSDSQKGAYENEFKNVLTPEQKQKLVDQLKQEGVTKDSLQKDGILPPVQKIAPAAPASTDALTQSIQSLTPEQRQKMIDALKSLNGGQQ